MLISPTAVYNVIPLEKTRILRRVESSVSPKKTPMTVPRKNDNVSKKHNDKRRMNFPPTVLFIRHITVPSGNTFIAEAIPKPKPKHDENPNPVPTEKPLTIPQIKKLITVSFSVAKRRFVADMILCLYD